MKLWTSDLETFRYWEESTLRADRADDPALELDEARLLAELRRRFKPTPAILAGQAFHKALEHYGTLRGGSIYRTDPFYVEGKEYAFTFAVPVTLEAPRAVESYFRLDVGRHHVTGKVDAITARGLVDYKTTPKPLYVEKFFDSWQWRVYLMAHPKAGRMRFELFRLVMEAPELWDNGRTVVPYTVTEQAGLDVWRYPGMDMDVAEAVERFVSVTAPLGWKGRR